VTDVHRFLVAAGTRHYLDADLAELPSVRTDIDRVVRLFTETLGYRRALDNLDLDPTTTGLTQNLSAWLTAAERTEHDLLTVYYSGHGEMVPGSYDADGPDSFRLCTASTLPDDEATYWRPETVVASMLDGPVRHLLIIIDACFSGAAARAFADTADRVNRMRTLQAGIDARLISAGRRELADEDVFTQALEHAITSPTRVGVHPYLDFESVIADINGWFENNPGQSRYQRAAFAMLSSPSTSLVPSYLPNPHRLRIKWRSELPDGDHWFRRARGIVDVGDTVDRFAGRSHALEQVTDVLTAERPIPSRRFCVVTGSPGAGKSAVLARVVIGGSTDAGRAVDAALNVAGRSVQDLVAGRAGLTGTTARTVETLIAGWTGNTVRVVLDSLDEAVDPQRHIEEVVIPFVLSGVADIRVVLATRSSWLARLPSPYLLVDLDSDRYFDVADLQAYVRGLFYVRNE
jgi:hypothetical protein